MIRYSYSTNKFSILTHSATEVLCAKDYKLQIISHSSWNKINVEHWIKCSEEVNSSHSVTLPTQPPRLIYFYGQKCPTFFSLHAPYQSYHARTISPVICAKLHNYRACAATYNQIKFIYCLFLCLIWKNISHLSAQIYIWLIENIMLQSCKIFSAENVTYGERNMACSDCLFKWHQP